MIAPVNSNVICFGEALWDIYNDSAIPGGAPMNVAIHLGNLGLESELISCVGNDKLGDELKVFLKDNNLSVQYIQTDKYLPTGVVNVELKSNNDAVYSIKHPSAWDSINISNDILKLVSRSGFFIYGTLAARSIISRNTLYKILESDILKIIDLNFRSPFDNRTIIEPLIGKADIIKLNEDEIKKIGSWHNIDLGNQELIRWLADIYSCHTIVLTLGRKGALVFYKGKVYRHGGYKVNAIDTVGAGDAFLAAFIFSLCNNMAIEEGLDLSCALSAFVASKRGATPPIDLNELHQIKNIRC